MRKEDYESHPLFRRWKKHFEHNYGYKDKNHKENACTFSKILLDMYNSFTSKIKENLTICDKNYDDRILSTDDNVYYQALAEMVLFDILIHNKFEILPSKSEGPDFVAKYNGNRYFFEVISPSSDNNGYHNDILSEINNNRLTPNPDRNQEYDHQSLLRITHSIKEKSEKFKNYINKEIISDNDICIIVINDHILKTKDTPLYGCYYPLTGPNSDIISAAFATTTKSYKHLTKLDEKENLYHESKPQNFITNNNNSKVKVNLFYNKNYSFISAIIQTSLYEDYAITKELFYKKEKSIKEIYTLGTIVKNKNANHQFTKHLNYFEVFEGNE